GLDLLVLLARVVLHGPAELEQVALDAQPFAPVQPGGGGRRRHGDSSVVVGVVEVACSGRSVVREVGASVPSAPGSMRPSTVSTVLASSRHPVAAWARCAVPASVGT